MADEEGETGAGVLVAMAEGAVTSAENMTGAMEAPQPQKRPISKDTQKK